MAADSLAEILWEYNHMYHRIEPSDCILVCGSQDLRVAERGAELFLQGLAPFIVFSGSYGRFTRDIFKKPEAEVFADIAREKGVPENAILIENKSTNTGENIAFSKALLLDRGINVNSLIVVHKPYMERRTYAVFKKIWPEKKIAITSPQLTFQEYIATTNLPKDEIISTLVGDTQRIRIYPEKGFQIAQDMPNEVVHAYNELVKLGYTKCLIT